MFHESMSRDRADGCATGQPQGVGSEAYLNGTSQGPTPEDARKDGQVRGRSKRFIRYPGWPGRSVPPEADKPARLHSRTMNFKMLVTFGP
jgi:hypothetical protein